MDKTILKRENVLTVLADNANVIKSYGVKQLGLFGSMARNENNADSDIDLLVDFEPGKKNYDNFIHLAYFLEDLLNRKVDLLTYQSLRPGTRSFIEKDIIHVAL